jgi:hypothetical protein
MGEPPKNIDARQPCANEKILPSQESNERGPRFDVAAVTIEIFAAKYSFRL